MTRDKQVGLRWPIPVDDRLDGLLGRAIGAGERTNRRELLAAIVATLEADGETLGTMLRRYRTMKVREVLLRPVVDDDTVVHLLDRKPGPRTATD